MKSILLLAIGYLLLSPPAKAQNKWLETKDWRVYKIRGHRIFAYSPDTLKNFKSYRLQEDSMKFFLKNVHELSTQSPIAWMGGYVVSYVVNNELRKAEVSAYGGFFYDDKTGKTFELPEDLRDDWLSFFRTTYLQLQ
jgi:hypothetical protein